MAVPKDKTSKARAKQRKSINMKLSAPNLVTCDNCGNKVQRHRVCKKCGFYRGKQIIEPEEMA